MLVCVLACGSLACVARPAVHPNSANNRILKIEDLEQQSAVDEVWELSVLFYM
jgi:hypothetical protein